MKPEDLEHTFSGGQCIVERGSEGERLFVIRSGNVLRAHRDGDPPRLLSEGDVFGEAAAILGQPYPFRAEAHGEVELLALDVAQLNRLCKENAEFAFRLIHHLAGQVAAVPAAGADSLENRRQTAGRRALAKAIHGRQDSGESNPVVVKGKLADLAEDAGISMLEAYYALHKLLDERVVRLVDDQLTLLDPEALDRVRGG